jgi:hypothetical protein
MNNDFVQGMEILIKCKQYVEFRLDFLQKQIERMDACGKDPRALQSEVNRLQSVLGYAVPPLYYDGEKE